MTNAYGKGAISNQHSIAIVGSSGNAVSTDQEMIKLDKEIKQRRYQDELQQ
jgi:flagellar basal body rod protein FlgB